MGSGEALLVGDCKISPGHGDYDAGAVYDDVKLIPRHAGVALQVFSFLRSSSSTIPRPIVPG